MNIIKQLYRGYLSYFSGSFFPRWISDPRWHLKFTNVWNVCTHKLRLSFKHNLSSTARNEIQMSRITTYTALFALSQNLDRRYVWKISKSCWRSQGEENVCISSKYLVSSQTSQTSNWKNPRKESTSLFNQYCKDAIPQTDKGYPQIRFLIVNRIFSKFLNEICKTAGVETNYTQTT